MATINSSQSIFVSLPIFDGGNYDLWGKKMETLFRSQNLWDIVEKGFKEPENISTLEEAQRKELEVKKQKDASALYLIQQSLDNNFFSRIVGASTANDAWGILQKKFHGDSEVRTIRLQTLRRELENIKMKDYHTVKDYHGLVKIMVNQMR